MLLGTWRDTRTTMDRKMFPNCGYNKGLEPCPEEALEYPHDKWVSLFLMGVGGH